MMYLYITLIWYIILNFYNIFMYYDTTMKPAIKYIEMKSLIF